MALIGNPIDFDRIRQRYESIVYPESKKTFQDSQFNQIRDTYAGLLQTANAPSQMGVLGGMGSQTISQDATQPGQQVQLRFNPATGQTETIIPEYMAPFRTDQQDFLPVSTPFPIEAADPNPVSDDPINVVDPTGQLINNRGGEGGFKDFQDRMNINTFNKYDPYSAFDRANISDTQQAFAGLLGGLVGAPIGGLSFIDKQLATKQLKDVFGISKSDMDKINENIKSGMTTEEALNAFREGSEDHKIGSFIGTGSIDEGFGLVSDSYLKDLTKKYEKDIFDELDEISIDDLMDSKGEGGYSPPSGTTGPGGGAGPKGGTGKPGDGTTVGSNSFGAGTGKGYGGSKSGGPPGTGAEGKGTGSGSGSGSGSGQGSGGGGGGDKNRDRGGYGGCFVQGTAIQMADGTTKEITTIKVGEETKGGTVQAKMEFMPQNIYNYKDVLVSGSHWVIEDNQFIAVEDSKHGVLTDRIEPVYTFKTSDNRIWINDIEFGDFETGTDEDWEPHFEMVREKLNKELRDGK